LILSTPQADQERAITSHSYHKVDSRVAGPDASTMPRRGATGAPGATETQRIGRGAMRRLEQNHYVDLLIAISAML